MKAGQLLADESRNAFPHATREIRIAVRGASVLVDSAAPFQFGKRKPAGGDKMSIKQ
jgi:hypothetical protein